MSFSDTIHVTFRPSFALRTLSVLAHGTVGGICAIWALTWPAFWGLAVLVGLLAYRAECMLTLRRGGAPVRLRWSTDQRLRCENIDGRVFEGICVEARSWGAAWVRLRMRTPKRRFARSIIIPFDAVDADIHRRLRARCRVMPPQRKA